MYISALLEIAILVQGDYVGIHSHSSLSTIIRIKITSYFSIKNDLLSADFTNSNHNICNLLNICNSNHNIWVVYCMAFRNVLLNRPL